MSNDLTKLADAIKESGQRIAEERKRVSAVIPAPDVLIQGYGFWHTSDGVTVIKQARDGSWDLYSQMTYSPAFIEAIIKSSQSPIR